MSAPPWQAERELDATWAAARIARACPDLAGATCVPFGEGWDNFAFLVADEWVFRFPRRQIAVGLLEAECAALRLLDGRLPLPIPCPEHVAPAGDGDPWPFSGYRLLHGYPACEGSWDDAARGRWAGPLGHFLASLHAVEVPDDVQVPRDEFARLDLSQRLGSAHERLLDASARGEVRDPATVMAALEAALDFVPRDDVLVHGDLDDGHLLLSPEGAPCGVIDWGDVHRGDPAVDLALVWSSLPPAARPVFLEAYGEVDPGRWRAARATALCAALASLEFAHEVRRPGETRRRVEELERALDGD